MLLKRVHDPQRPFQLRNLLAFEFDYAGIIIGKDMVYDFGTNAWKGQPESVIAT